MNISHVRISANNHSLALEVSVLSASVGVAALRLGSYVGSRVRPVVLAGFIVELGGFGGLVGLLGNFEGLVGLIVELEGFGGLVGLLGNFEGLVGRPEDGTGRPVGVVGTGVG